MTYQMPTNRQSVSIIEKIMCNMKASEIIAKTINEMFNVAQNEEIRSPDWWIDKAVILNALRQNLEDACVVAEMSYKKEIAQHIADGDKITEAKLKVESTSEQYRLYNNLMAQSEIVKEQINLAKKRQRMDSTSAL